MNEYVHVESLEVRTKGGPHGNYWTVKAQYYGDVGYQLLPRYPGGLPSTGWLSAIRFPTVEAALEYLREIGPAYDEWSAWKSQEPKMPTSEIMAASVKSSNQQEQTAETFNQGRRSDAGIERTG